MEGFIEVNGIHFNKNWKGDLKRFKKDFGDLSKFKNDPEDSLLKSTYEKFKSLADGSVPVSTDKGKSADTSKN